ncbi:hypothetical protein [Palleronia caenipelagi]|uniref:Uncharacterized protein n=1 Tax=Palleronia caenipelagi TaxID=2489174 RepID=A0A547PS35_9RHOB|nr:hypothetical protein [Palleronia caenipelagi]TRD16943.1 hypothetical protein FEV53_13470 [Palleronia caenipelagi]
MLDGSDFTWVLYSDVSDVAADVLVSRGRLWVLNTLLHFAGGFIGMILSFGFPALVRPMLVLLGGYVVLQGVQLVYSPGDIWKLVSDSFVDLLAPLFGMASAWSIMMMEARRDA